MPISSSPSRVENIFPRRRDITLRIRFTCLSVYGLFSLPLMLELSRYMPKKKEVHLKKLIKGGEDAKEHDHQVRSVNFMPSHSPLGNTGRKGPTHCLLLAFQFDTRDRYGCLASASQDNAPSDGPK